MWLVPWLTARVCADLRLELLGAEAGALRGALYGLLMLLPQSDAFHALRARLHAAPPAAPAPAPPPAPDVPFPELLQQFARVQAAHREYRMLDRGRGKLAS